MSNSPAPVCGRNPPSPPPTGNAPLLPAIPIASADNPQSMADAINALRQWILGLTSGLTQPSSTLAGQAGQAGQAGPGQAQGGSGGINSTVGSRTQPGNFTQTKITTAQVKVSNPDDPTQYVMVEQVTGVTWTNGLGQTITWTQGS